MHFIIIIIYFLSLHVSYAYLRIMPIQKKLNEYIRWLIVEKSLEGLSCRTITGHLNISKSSISRVCLHFQKYGCV
ncbi:hypothetical protein C1645_786585 [Glomus cerebriforme]|uniref:Uncharacterized protein n=1 Tax=Glomus cerebriforme TaxID=658196 RepID=A0A397SKM1_9GLOM|nr:hypothetical protein C1645_786585 [Glomus cerebriforme]